MMTKRDYEALATAFAEVQEMLDDPHFWNTNEAPLVLGLIRDRVADALASNNPQFNRDRFVAACGFVAEEATR